MSDDPIDNEVKEAMLDALMSDYQVNRVKQKLLAWLILFGKSEVTAAQLLEHDIIGMDMWGLIDKGLVIENSKTATYTLRLTKKAINYINKGEKHDK